MAIFYPLQTVIFNTMSIVDPQKPEPTSSGFDWRSYFVRGITSGIFGLSLSSDDLFDPFVWDTPTSNGDRLGGGICAVTNYWAPAHSMVHTDRGMAIKEFAQNDHVGENR